MIATAQSLSIPKPAGIAFDIQRSSMNDGPGIRTTVFLKGCPLRCRWCHNPESWKIEPQQALPVRPGEPPVVYGDERTVEEVMSEVRKDRAYYEASGGGMTVSGGEPMVQFDFCRDLLKAAHNEGFHTCLDTSGCAPLDHYLAVLPYVDLFLWDYKATGRQTHRALTGVEPDLILKNFEALYEAGASLLLRCPLVPDANDSAEHLTAIARIGTQHPRLAGIEILPYHDIGLSKYDRLGMPRPDMVSRVPDEATKDRWREVLRSNNCPGVLIH